MANCTEDTVIDIIWRTVELLKTLLYTEDGKLKCLKPRLGQGITIMRYETEENA